MTISGGTATRHSVSKKGQPKGTEAAGRAVFFQFDVSADNFISSTTSNTRANCCAYQTESAERAENLFHDKAIWLNPAGTCKTISGALSPSAVNISGRGKLGMGERKENNYFGSSEYSSALCKLQIWPSKSSCRDEIHFHCRQGPSFFSQRTYMMTMRELKSPKTFPRRERVFVYMPRIGGRP